ncbi:MAG: FtsX-like permease family protein [Kosmotoga sp.]|nr:MAG: FtsX-like permease family protein [Kosmotoga sp.]
MLINLLVIAVAASLIIVIISMLRNKIAFKIGFRNIFRRKADTFLVVAGSLIGTALIVGSFAMNDSFQKFIFSQIEKRFGEVDIAVTATTKETDNPYIKYENIETLVERLNESEIVDGVIPVVAKEVIVGIPGKTRNMEPDFSETVWLMGLDEKKISNFGSDNDKKIDFDLSENGVIISEKLANNLDLKVGDKLELMRDASLRFVFWAELPTITVEGIIKPEGILGYQGTAMANYGGSIITTPENARRLLEINIVNSYTELLVSNKGDYLSGAKYSSRVEQLIEENAPDSLTLKINKVKESQIEDVSQSNIDILFLALSFFAILAGILLLSNIYLMLAEERRTELGTLRALGYTRKKVSLVILYEGFFYSLLASIIGVPVGMGISKFLLDKFVNLFTNITGLIPVEGASQFGQTFQMSFNFYIKPQSIFYGFFLGLIVPMAVVLYSCRKISRMNIVKAVRGIPEYFTERSKQIIKIISIAGFIIGLLIVIASFSSSNAIGFFIGLVVTIMLFPFLLPESIRRILVTISGISVVVFTMLSNNIEFISQSGDSLVLMIAKGFTILFAGLLLVVYNLRIFEMLLTAIFKKFKESSGVFKVALAFAARNRRRTGLTIAMYALVIFIITLISIIPYSQEKNLKESRNLFFMGYDVGIVSMKSNASNAEDYKELDYITSLADVKSLSIGLKHDTGRVSSFQAYVFGDSFGTTGIPELSNFELIPEVRKEIDNVKALWNYMRKNPKSVVLNGALSAIASLEIGQKINLVTITGGRNMPMQQPSFGDSIETGEELGEFTIIGKVKNSSLTFLSGFMISDNALQGVDLNNATTFILANLKGSNTEEKQKYIKELRTVTNSNAQIPLFVDDLIKLMTQTINGMIDILRSFLYFGMIVGIVGIAIIMVKALYERRRLVGMLKAIGFTKKMVFSSFWIETSFTVLIGILLGMITGALTSQELFSSASFNGVNMAIPWNQLLGMGIIFYLISLMATFIPSYIASKMSPAKALRYFE